MHNTCIWLKLREKALHSRYSVRMVINSDADYSSSHLCKKCFPLQQRFPSRCKFNESDGNESRKESQRANWISSRRCYQLNGTERISYISEKLHENTSSQTHMPIQKLQSKHHRIHMNISIQFHWACICVVGSVLKHIQYDDTMWKIKELRRKFTLISIYMAH